MDAFGTPGELNRALIDGSMPVGNFASSAISAERAASMLGGLKQINQRGFAEGTGKKKAVFIGINYTGTESELRGCINDVRNMHAFIKGNFGFPDENMIILTDDNPNPSSMPVAQNILSALSWLVQDAAAGDSLFLHYSGHGGTARTMSGAVQTIIPLDFKNTGQISDVQLHELVCKRVPPGCQLTAIFDSCHSGSVLNLPYSLLPTAASDSSSFPSLLQINGNSGIGATLLGMLGSWASDPAMVGQLLSQLRPQGYSAMLGGREIVTNDAGVEAKQPKHTIQPGDTFWKLVQEGKAESVDVLLQCNPGVVPEMLMPGQIINLAPAPSPVDAALMLAGGISTYTVQPGDTYYQLVQKGKAISVEALLAANPGVNPENLQIGQVINVPVSAAAGTGGVREVLEATSIPYTIVEGDTFWNLVEQGKSISVEALQAVNPNVVPENLQIGQIINLPCSSRDRSFGSLLGAILNGIITPAFIPPNNSGVPTPQAQPTQSGPAMVGQQKDATAGTCIQFAGCQDNQTSADSQIGGKPTGALSWAFLTAMAQLQRPTYEQLLVRIRELLAGKFTQIPQLSSGFPMDPKQPFSI